MNFIAFIFRSHILYGYNLFCTSVVRGEYITHPQKGEKIPSKGFFTCNSSNVIYTIKCPCGKMYIGQTSRAIKIRLTEHKSNIRRYQQKMKDEGPLTTEVQNKFGESTVARHFYEARHNISELRWQIIEEIYRDQVSLGKRLLQREAFWITTFETLVPKGLNEECNLNVFL